MLVILNACTVEAQLDAAQRIAVQLFACRADHVRILQTRPWQVHAGSKAGTSGVPRRTHVKWLR
jgi:hypothetical protein